MMVRQALFTTVLLACVGTSGYAKETALTAILAGLDQLKTIKKMDNARTYELEARGAKVTGVPDDFLRRRLPAEILQSGLSCGCGDYAYAFQALVAAKGFQVVYLDGVAMNFVALERGDSGHTGVAVKDPESGNWILVDPTFGRILSGDWNPESEIYEGPAGRFWIGYRGPVDTYPVKDHPGLRAFYEETLKKVPKKVWEQTLVAFAYEVDDSLRTKEGSYANPNLEAFLVRSTMTLKALDVHPALTVKVKLKAWSMKPKETDLVQEADGSWSFFVNEKSALSSHLTDYLLSHVQRKSAHG